MSDYSVADEMMAKAGLSIEDEDDGPPRTEPWPEKVFELIAKEHDSVIKRRHLVGDLETIVDFMNEAAGVGAREPIRDAHDIKGVLFGEQRTRGDWPWIQDWLNLANPRNSTPAWPDVRLRMIEVLKRAGGEFRGEE